MRVFSGSFTLFAQSEKGLEQLFFAFPLILKIRYVAFVLHLLPFNAVSLSVCLFSLLSRCIKYGFEFADAPFLLFSNSNSSLFSLFVSCYHEMSLTTL